MPITVRKQITVTEVRQGDRLDETPPALVESLTRKAVWGAVQVAGEARPRRLRLDAPVTVLREELTPEETAQARRAYMTQVLKDALAGWLQRDPAGVLQKILDTNRGNVEVLTWSNLSDVLKAQATFKHARALHNRLGQPDDLAAVDDDALLEAFASWWYTHVHRLIEDGPGRDRLSRSTSVISNIIEDCDDWAVDQIRSRIIWAGAREELERRVTRILAARDAHR